MDDADFGTLTRDGDRYRLTYVRHFAHPIEKVWRAISEPQHLAVWFPDEIVGERRAGAALRFVTSSGDGFDGQMLAFEPPSLIELMWGTDHLRIELHPEGDGTRFVLVDTFGELGKAARDGAGWHECVARLACALDGETPGQWDDEWRAVHTLYVERFGPAAATIGPPG
jgi:uncharacterized protein YndB with AHSA1/START domain